jgi:ABC-type multidrug transport system fused ATPase/permease subunit
MGSGLIYLIIVGMWVSYFLPQWVSSHEEVSGKSVEKFRNSMRAVAHSAGVPTQEELARENEHNLVVRRIVFSSLALLLILTSVLSLVGLLSPIVMLLPVSGISLYIAHVRRQMQAMRSAIRQQRIISQHNQKPTSTNYAELLARSKVVREKNEVLEHWIPLSERIEKVEQELSGITLLPKGSASAHHEWTPQEVPTPTYVSAPKAVTAKRIIDLTIPGAWSEEQAKLNSEVSEVSPHRDQVFDQEDGGSARAVNS